VWPDKCIGGLQRTSDNLYSRPCLDRICGDVGGYTKGSDGAMSCAQASSAGESSEVSPKAWLDIKVISRW
jgi:hypothetical protein